VSFRVIALGVASLLVLAIGVHLFLQVHASPASAAVSPRASTPESVAATPPSDDTQGPSTAHNSGSTARPELAGGAAAPADDGAEHPHVAAHMRQVGEETPDDAEGSDGHRHRHVAGFPRDKDGKVNKDQQKREADMIEANKAYDRGDTDEAREIAKRIVDAEPGNIRMLRILVSTSCLDGDAAAAKQYYATLPKGDQAQMQTRCARYGVNFTDAQ
jgi:hypothetical protein